MSSSGAKPALPAPAAWSAVTTYGAGQLAIGSDNNLYASLAAGNLNHDPTTDGGVHWTMAPVASAKTWSPATNYNTGALVTASDGNLYAALQTNINHNPVGDGGVNWTKTPPSNTAKVHLAAAVSIANSTPTAVVWDTQDWATPAGMFVVGATPTQLICKKAGRYRATANGAWAANVNGERMMQIRQNGTDVSTQSRINANATVGDPTSASVSADVVMAVNDYLELIVYQTSGGALNFGLGAGDLRTNFSLVEQL